jgi:hypothetical protein
MFSLPTTEFTVEKMFFDIYSAESIWNWQFIGQNYIGQTESLANQSFGNWPLKQ